MILSARESDLPLLLLPALVPLLRLPRWCGDGCAPGSGLRLGGRSLPPLLRGPPFPLPLPRWLGPDRAFRSGLVAMWTTVSSWGARPRTGPSATRPSPVPAPPYRLRDCRRLWLPWLPWLPWPALGVVPRGDFTDIPAPDDAARRGLRSDARAPDDRDLMMCDAECSRRAGVMSRPSLLSDVPDRGRRHFVSMPRARPRAPSCFRKSAAARRQVDSVASSRRRRSSAKQGRRFTCLTTRMVSERLCAGAKGCVQATVVHVSYMAWRSCPQPTQYEP